MEKPKSRKKGMEKIGVTRISLALFDWQIEEAKKAARKDHISIGQVVRRSLQKVG